MDVWYGCMVLMYDYGCMVWMYGIDVWYRCMIWMYGRDGMDGMDVW